MSKPITGFLALINPTEEELREARKWVSDMFPAGFADAKITEARLLGAYISGMRRKPNIGVQYGNGNQQANVFVGR